MGTLVGVLTLLRIFWWLIFDRRPSHQAGTPHWQANLAHTVHIGLYGLILVMVCSGVATIIMTGANLQLFGSAPLPLPELDLAPPMAAHGILARVLIALLLGHVGAALWHQFGRQDHLLARMGVGK
jgi:cytochrome b561